MKLFDVHQAYEEKSIGGDGDKVARFVSRILPQKDGDIDYMATGELLAQHIVAAAKGEAVTKADLATFALSRFDSGFDDLSKKPLGLIVQGMLKNVELASFVSSFLMGVIK